MNFDKTKTFCYTGHRTFKLSDPIEVQNALWRMTQKAIGAGYEYAISGAAHGVDLWGADCALAQGLKLILAIPFAGHCKYFNEEDKISLNVLKESAYLKTVISKPPPGFSKCSEQNQRKWVSGTLHSRNNWMVNKSNSVLAIWRASIKTGGTYNCIRYAVKNNVKVLCFDPDQKGYFLVTSDLI